METMTSLETMRSMRLVREYAEELLRDEYNPRREQSLRHRIKAIGLLDQEAEPSSDDPVIESPSDRR